MKNKKEPSGRSVLYYSILPGEPQLFMGHLGPEPKTNMKTLNYPSRYSMSDVFIRFAKCQGRKYKVTWTSRNQSSHFSIKTFFINTKHHFLSNDPRGRRAFTGSSGESWIPLKKTSEELLTCDWWLNKMSFDILFFKIKIAF